MIMITNSLIAYRLRNKRRNKQFSIEKICTLTNIDKRKYKAYEKGKARPIDEELEKMSSVLEVDIHELIGDVDPYEKIELEAKRKNRNFRYIQFGIFVVVVIILSLIIELASTPRVSSRFDAYDDYGYKYTYEVTNSKLLGRGSLVLLESDNDGEINVPETVTIQSGIFPNSFEVIGVNLAGLKGDVYIPKSVSKILKYEYDRIDRNAGYTLLVPNAKSIKVDPQNPYFDSREDCNCVIETKTNKLIAAARMNAFIPESVVEITSAAFNMQDDLKINIPENVKKIKPFAFCNVGGSLSGITFNEGLEEIGDFAFFRQEVYNFDPIISVSLPSSLKKLSRFAFCYYKVEVYIRCDDIDSVLCHQYINNPQDECSIWFTYDYLSFDSIDGRVYHGGWYDATLYYHASFKEPEIQFHTAE